MCKNLSFIFIFTFPLLAFGATPTVEINTEASEVSFLAIGRPSVIKIRGEKAKPQGSLSFTSDGKVGGEIKVDLNDFSTGISMRDRHMKEKYFETQKEDCRYAVIQITKIDFPPDVWSVQKAGEYSFTGILTLHGVKKDMQGKLNIGQWKKDSISGSSNFAIKLTDYGIQIPSFSGVTVAESVDVQVRFDARTSVTN